MGPPRGRRLLLFGSKVETGARPCWICRAPPCKSGAELRTRLIDQASVQATATTASSTSIRRAACYFVLLLPDHQTVVLLKEAAGIGGLRLRPQHRAKL